MEGLWPLKEDNRDIWYTVPYTRESEYWAAFEVWSQWLLNHPEYSVPTHDYQYSNLIRKLFPY